MSVLDEILASKRREIAARRGTRVAGTAAARSCLDVHAALERAPGTPLRLIAEVKRKSPSAGPLSRALTAEDRALVYVESGAAMVSVLCDGPFFDGSFDDLARARARLDDAGRAVPLLAKEFVLDEVQLDLARAAGADAVLLIARIVTPEELARLTRACRARGMEPLLEVTDEDELASALSAGGRVIGVNARDLDTLVIDKVRTARVLAAIPAGHVAVHLSGIGTAEAVRSVAAGRPDAALIGEALMRKDAPGALLAEMVAAARALRT